jgi:hypothetical protein
MSRIALWLAITPKQAEALINALPSRDKTVKKLLDELESTNIVNGFPFLNLDKSWEPIHRCLTDDHSVYPDYEAGDFPLKFCVMGGAQLLFEHSYITASLLLPDEVRAVAIALPAVSQKTFHDKFFKLRPSFHEITEEVFEWVWSEYRWLPAFFYEAAKQKLAVVCRISR